MIENKRLEELILAFPEDVQVIFKEMIQAYQLGYADYVYQTDQRATQQRRIKNLVKNFRKMDYFYVMPLSQDLALEIALHWKYEPPYQAYSLQADSQVSARFLSAEARGEDYVAVIRNGALIGYGRWEKTKEVSHLFLAMKPSVIGQGYGRGLYQAIEAHIQTQVTPFRPHQIRVAVPSNNPGAKRFFEKVGFQQLSDLSTLCPLLGLESQVLTKEIVGKEVETRRKA